MHSVHYYTIPYQDKHIIYNPLKRIAFIGNNSMLDLCAKGKNNSGQSQPGKYSAYDFLESINFFGNDLSIPTKNEKFEPFRPTVSVLFLTNQCNLRCVYCYAHAGEDDSEQLSLNMAKSAIDQVCRNAISRSMDHYTLSFHGGGEPTMAWHLLKDCVSHARQTKLPATISLTSNGVWSNRQRDWILDNIDEISLSLDGFPEIQNQQRPLANGNPSHTRVMSTVHKLDHRRKAYGIRVTITENSIVQIPKIIEYLCRETDARAFQVEPAFNHGRAKQYNQAVSNNEHFAEAFMEGYDIACQHQRHMYYSGARPWLLTNRFCDAFDNALIVGPGGFVTSCYEVCNTKHELANLFCIGTMNQQGDITYNQQVRQEFRRRIAARKNQCRNCFCFFHCAGDCPAKTMGHPPGKQDSTSSRCWLNQTITRELIARYIMSGDGIWMGDQNATYCMMTSSPEN
jgi:uncharacterized protein